MTQRLLIILTLFFSFSAQAVDILTTAENNFYQAGHNIRVGVEVEFSNIKVKEAAKIVAKILDGKMHIRNIKVKTNIREITKEGKVVYNTQTIREYVVDTKQLGSVILKLDNNQVSDDAVLDLSKSVVELVTEPIYEHQKGYLQQIITAMKQAGAIGTRADLAVATQMNTEVAEGILERVNWQQIVDIIRAVSHPEHVKQMADRMKVPPIRQQYINGFSKGFIAKVSDPSYVANGRNLYDDLIYRQSLEFLQIPNAWTMPIKEARATLLARITDRVVPQVVKQTFLRVSSLLMWAFPDDPMSVIYEETGWAKGRPLLEWRGWNTDFDVVRPYKQAIGLILGAEKYGYYDHDRLIAELSGVEYAKIRQLQKKTIQAEAKGENVIVRYFLGDPKNVDRSDYQKMRRAYDNTVVTFLPFQMYGTEAVTVPGNSVVMHRLPLHRYTIQGKYNPSLINYNIVQALENKYVESKFWGEYAPGSMPETLLLTQLVSKKTLTPGVRGITIQSVTDIEKALNKKFPNGWVMKGAWDLGSEKQIITNKTRIVERIRAYKESDFEEFRVRIAAEGDKSQWAPEYVLGQLKEHRGFKGWKILQMLEAPELTIVQEMVSIDREFRVEVIAGRVLGGKSTTDRYKYEYTVFGKTGYVAPEKWMFEKVENFAQRIVERLPEDLRYMTFGMDIAVLKNGALTMIESNPGGNSNFLYEEENESVRALRKELEKFPERVAAGEIHLGLSPERQMEYLLQKFADWKVKPAQQYPDMSFEENRIEDAEFVKKEVDIRAFQITPPTKIFSCRSIFVF